VLKVTATGAQQLVTIKSRDKKLWVDAMMVEELGMLRMKLTRC
jgi:hypothetical protein